MEWLRPMLWLDHPALTGAEYLASFRDIWLYFKCIRPLLDSFFRFVLPEIGNAQGAKNQFGGRLRRLDQQMAFNGAVCDAR
jgi:hypothetical protein